MTCCFFFFCNGQTMDHPYCFILEFVSRLFHSVWSASTWNSGRHPGLAAFFCCRSQAWVSPIGSLGSFPTPHPTALPVNREQSALDFSRKVWQHSQAGKDDCHCHAQCRGLWFRMSGHGPEGHCWWIHVGPFPVTPLAFERRRPVALCSKKRAADWSSGLDVHDWDVDPWIIDIYIYIILIWSETVRPWKVWSKYARGTSIYTMAIHRCLWGTGGYHTSLPMYIIVNVYRYW